MVKQLQSEHVFMLQISKGHNPAKIVGERTVFQHDHNSFRYDESEAVKVSTHIWTYRKIVVVVVLYLMKMASQRLSGADQWPQLRAPSEQRGIDQLSFKWSIDCSIQ